MPGLCLRKFRHWEPPPVTRADILPFLQREGQPGAIGKWERPRHVGHWWKRCKPAITLTSSSLLYFGELDSAVSIKGQGPLSALLAHHASAVPHSWSWTLTSKSSRLMCSRVICLTVGIHACLNAWMSACTCFCENNYDVAVQFSGWLQMRRRYCVPALIWGPISFWEVKCLLPVSLCSWLWEGFHLFLHKNVNIWWGVGVKDG